MGALANKLNPASAPTTNTDGQARTTTITGPHDDSSYEGILSSCREPVTVKFAAPPSVYRKFKDDGSLAFTTYRYKLVDKNAGDTTISPGIAASWRNKLQTQPQFPRPAMHLSCTYLICIADPQLGKPGTAETVENWKRGVFEHAQTIRDMQELNRSPERIHVAWMGDETEGVCNNYTNQSHVTELNLSQQLELDYDLRVWTLKLLSELGLPITASSVISNHGEWTRNGGKDPVTSRNDNSSTYVARQVQKLFDEAANFGGPQIGWTIGDSDPAVVVNLSGVDTYFSHGYVEKGRGGSTEIRTKDAISKQILGRTETLGSVPLYVVAHYHHFYMNEFEGRTLFGCPALESAAGSREYMLDQFGVWSPAGMLGLLVGAGFDRGWSGLSVV